MNRHIIADNRPRNTRLAAIAAFLFAALILAGATPGLAQTLSVGSASGLPGAAVDVTVTLNPASAQVSTLQFDLGFGTALTYVSTTAGSAATNAGKSVSASTVTGGIRVIIFALNNTAMGSGAVATVRFNISGSAPAGTQTVAISGIVASDPIGNSVGVSGTGGTVTVTAPADTTPPTISAVAVSSITQNSAVVTWTTNEGSDTQVEYGTTASYGSLSSLNTSMVTSHSQTISGLASGTLYHYRARSRDAANNLGTSTDFTFTTTAAPDTTPPTISSVSASSITQNSAVVSWSTNEASNTQVQYGTTTSYGSSTTINSSMVTSHSQALSGLSASTLYHYRVLSRDAANNLATSADFTFNTTATPDTTPPVISSVSASPVTYNAATITWTTSEASNTQVQYGTTTGYGSSTTINSSMVTSHSQALSGLSASTLYHYRVLSRDAANNLATSADFTFTTAATPDTTPPVISSVSSGSVTQNAAVVTWSTNEAADTQVEYGTTPGYGSTTTLNSGLVTSHSQAVSGLSANTLYYFRVRSRDGSGNLAISGGFTFTTTEAADTTPPVISSVTAGSLTQNSAVVSWSTNEAADTQVEYGATAAYGSSTALNSGMSTSHSQSVSGLSANTLYHYRVKSRDASGNLATSTDYTFTTSQSSDTTPPAITGVVINAVTKSTAVITWSTNEDSDSQVEYGLTATYGSLSTTDTFRTQGHAITLSGLTPETTYSFRVKSRDASGNLGLSGNFTFVTLKGEDEPETPHKFYFPRIKFGTRIGNAAATSDEYTGVAVANLDLGSANLTFTAYDSAGNAVAGEGITNPATRVLNPGQQLPIIDTQLFGEAIGSSDSAGWIKIESSISKIAGFFLMFDGSLNVLDGANVSTKALTTFVLPEIEGQGFTRLNLANPDVQPATVRIDLIRQDGSPRGSVTNLFPENPPQATDYVRVTSDVGILPFQMLGKTSQYVEGLNGQDVAAGSTVLYSPQFVVGGPWRSTVSLINLESRVGSITLRYIGDDATQIGSTRSMSVEGYGKIFIDDQAFFQAAGAGQILSGYIEITSTVKLTGSVVFGDPDRSRFSSSLPLVTTLQDSILFAQVASNDVYFTGLAMLNPHTQDAVATIDLYNSDGYLEASATEVIGARRRISKLLTQIFPAMAGQNRSSGYIRVNVTRPVAGFALFGTSDLSVLSAVPPQEIPQ
jgi:hypothetical protein